MQAYSGVPAVAHFKAIELEEDDGSVRKKLKLKPDLPLKLAGHCNST